MRARSKIEPRAAEPLAERWQPFLRAVLRRVLGIEAIAEGLPALARCCVPKAPVAGGLLSLLLGDLRGACCLAPY